MTVGTPPVGRTVPPRDDPPIAPQRQWSSPVAMTPTPLRRRPALLVLGLCLTALGGVMSAWLYAATSNTVTIVAVAAPVQRGQLLTADMLTTASIVNDPRLDTVPGEELTSLVGRRAALDLAAGGVVTTSSVTDAVVPGQGESVVGVTLTRAQLPSEPLVAGDVVRLVATPRAQDDTPTQPPAVIEAVVQATTSVEETGEIIVDVLLPDASAPALAAQAATGRIALVLDSRAR